MRDRMARKVLVATDLSDQSPALLAAGADAAQKLGAEMIVLHVFDPEAYEKIFGETGMPVDQYTGYIRAELQDQLKAAGVGTARLEIIEGRAIALAILSTAARMHPDLIVVGMRRRKGLRRTLGGGVADEVLRRARTGVLVMPQAALDVMEPVAVAS